MRTETWALVAAAASVGALHTAAPDHWLPFAALARARRWSSARAARTTLSCGFGHVTVSALFGLVAILLGLEVVHVLGKRLESVAGLLLVVFGVVYAMWGLRQRAGKRLHGHAHAHYDHVHEEKHMTEWSLFLLYSADPCVAVIPLMLAAAPSGKLAVFVVVLAYEIATLGAMLALVLPAARGASLIPDRLFRDYEHAAAGACIAVVGVIVSLLGI